MNKSKFALFTLLLSMLTSFVAVGWTLIAVGMLPQLKDGTAHPGFIIPWFFANLTLVGYLCYRIVDGFVGIDKDWHS